MGANVNRPLVSIIIPVYNGANYMKDAIDSALKQDYDNIEVLLVNDGSCDDGATEAIALSYGDRIRYISKENGGVSSALNLGIKHMRGDYFSWLSHDDLYTPEKVRVQVEALLAGKDCNMLSLCGSYQIDKTGKRLSDANGRSRFNDGEVVEWRAVLADLLLHGSFNGCALLIPRRVFDDCGLFHEGLRFSQDYLMWLSIFLKGYSLLYVANEAVANRVHDGQLTQRGQDIFHRDSRVIGTLLIPAFLRVSTPKEDLLYLFALYNAKYANFDVVSDCVKKGKENRLFSSLKMAKIRAVSLYGRVRPLIRKVYYRLFKGVKTK